MLEMPAAKILQVLQTGSMETEGLLPWSSNYTFLVRVCSETGMARRVELDAVYKPQRGERPLWDFAQGSLCKRERAAFIISQALGWHLVPPTVLREGTHGFGSVQLFVEHDPEQHYFTFEGNPNYRTQLQKIVLFDILVNNADRKSGHVLLEEATSEVESDRLWGIDHGICFHAEPKLRTVIWEFVEQPIPAELKTHLTQLDAHLAHPRDTLPQALAELLSPQELKALRQRLHQLIDQTRFPNPGPGRHYPWPPV